LKKTLTGILFVCFFTLVFPCNGQILKDSVTVQLLRKGVDYIYNLQFDEARDIYRSVFSKYPDQPILYVYKGLITYWENFPITPNSPQKESFENEMLRAIELIEEKPDNETDPEMLLGNIGARGLLLLFYADNDLTRDVISMASSTYKCVKAAFKHTQTYADFYFITGLYNYYREAYPEVHPVYKPIALLFPKGDKMKGLKELQIASKNAIVLKAEAFSFLSGIYISFENNFQQAYNYSKALHDLYPKNQNYLAMYIKNLILVKKYTEADHLIKSNKDKYNNRFFQAQISVLSGILLEKYHKNKVQAQYFYEKGIKEIEPFGTFGSEYAAYAYYGLSRLITDKHQKKAYRKKAIDLSDFENVNFD
jgi:hypothetical protein